MGVSPSAEPRSFGSHTWLTAAAVGTICAMAAWIIGTPVDSAQLEARETLRALQAGACGGTADAAFRLPELDLRQLPSRRGALGLRCPAVLRGVFEHAGVASAYAALWADLAYWRRAATEAEIAFDLSPSHIAAITHWDNSTRLARHAQRIGRAKQGHARVHADVAAFAAAIASGHARYVGRLRTFSPRVARELQLGSGGHYAGGLAAVAPGSSSSRDGGTHGAPGGDVSLCIAGGGVTSTARYEASDALLLLAAGSQRVRLARPTDSHRLGVRPSVHPHARQARGSLHSTAGFRDGEPRAVYVDLTAAEAVFIPSGWMHSLTSLGPSASVSLHAPPPDYLRLVRLMERLPPFTDEDVGAGGGGGGADGDAWSSPGRLSSALLSFLPRLFSEAELPTDDVPSDDEPPPCPKLPCLTSRGAKRSPVGDLLSAYGPATRAELGLPEEGGVWWPLPCTPLASDSEDFSAVVRSASSVGAEFRSYRAELRWQYMGMYLEALLMRLGGTVAEHVGSAAAGEASAAGDGDADGDEGLRAEAATLAAVGGMLGFVEHCLADIQA